MGLLQQLEVKRSLFFWVTKAHTSFNDITTWEGDVAVASLPSMGFFLTFLQGQFVAGLLLAELPWPCCINAGNIMYPCRATSLPWQRAQCYLIASTNQKLPGFRIGISIPPTGKELTDWKITMFPLKA